VPTSTVVLIEGLHLQACIGVPKSERGSPQALVVDIRLTLLCPDIAEDRMSASVNYARIAKMLRGLAAEKHWHLLEAFAEDAARRVLEDPRIAEAWFRVRKPRRLSDCEFVGVERAFSRG
jgi:dihydroneopterin aldolase